jgi:hypothetical protein
LNLVLNAKVADYLGDDETGMPVAELAKKTGIDEGKSGRIMRFLASTHIFTEGTHLPSHRCETKWLTAPHL